MIKTRFTLCGFIALGALMMVGSGYAALNATGGPNLFGYFFRANQPMRLFAAQSILC
jgi:hypothetical protein